jgi:hypothetical protein
VLRALSATGFPVPHVRALCIGDDVIGAWFYAIDMVEGRIFWDATFPAVSNHDGPGNYFERQIAPWTKQYLEDQDAGRDSNMQFSCGTCGISTWGPGHVRESPV